MFWYYLDFLDTSFLLFVSFAGAVTLALILGIAFHEFCHALSASILGDQTAARLGRLTLNPLAHLDPLGSFLLLFLGFGWGKPTPVNPNNLRNGRTGMAMVAAAGPISNLLVATLLAAPIRLGWVPWHNPFSVINSTAGWASEDYIGLFLSASIAINCLLAVFNLLPIAPLDGFKVWVGVLPIELARPLAQMERYGIVILLAFVFIGPSFGIRIFPIASSIGKALTGQ